MCLLEVEIYQLCDICVQIDKKNINLVLSDSWKQFIVEDYFGNRKVDIKIQIVHRDSTDYQIERYNTFNNVSTVLRYGSEILLINEDGKQLLLLEPKDQISFQVFTNHIFYSRVIYHKMIQCHSALVDWKGMGILFLGPSGIGKTTQAERWAEYRGADIVNGDLVFVQQIEDRFLGWGTPWHGSSPYCINRAVSLKALVVLKQSKENRIRELTGFEKVSEVSNNVFYPTWLDDGMELCTEVLNNLLLQLPVYRLDNRADEGAVELVEKAILCIDK